MVLQKGKIQLKYPVSYVYDKHSTHTGRKGLELKCCESYTADKSKILTFKLWYKNLG